jgi:hypothetical protein
MRLPFFSLLFASIALSSLSPAQSFSKSSYPVAGEKIERADFTSDGFEDLLVYDKLRVQILPNAGNGTFDNDRIFSIKAGLFDATLVDFNRDGNVDVAGCHQGVIVYQGTGQGTLTQGLTIPGNCSWIVSGDFNGDGNPDLAIGTSTPRNQIIVYLGDGQGGISGQVVNDNVNFTSNGVTCGVGLSAVAADFTGEKKLDIVFQANCDNESTNVAGSALVVGKGDGTGHFSFHKDQDYNFSGSKLRIVDGNQDGRRDIYFVGETPAPDQSRLLLLISNGNGTFAPPKPILTSTPFTSNGGSVIEAATVTDLDGDGVKDGLAVMRALDASGNPSYFLQLAKGMSDGSYIQIRESSLASGAFDMLWGDFDKDARVDLAFTRGKGNLIPSTTDVWLNIGNPSRACAQPSAIRSLTLCPFPGANFLFIANPLDNRLINAMQIYVDGVLRFETPDDRLAATLHLDAGTHRVTAKAWDDLGSFSTTTNVTAFSSCSNISNRTVEICSPQNGAVLTTDGKQAPVAHIVATAATNLAFKAIQVYIDGTLTYQNTTKSIDIQSLLKTSGTHHITVKGWDSKGSFSSMVAVTVQ